MLISMSKQRAHHKVLVNVLLKKLENKGVTVVTYAHDGIATSTKRCALGHIRDGQALKIKKNCYVFQAAVLAVRQACKVISNKDVVGKINIY